VEGKPSERFDKCFDKFYERVLAMDKERK